MFCGDHMLALNLFSHSLQNTRVIKKVNFHFLLNIHSAIFFLVLNPWKIHKENFDLSL